MTLNRLSAIFDRFRVSTYLFQAGALCATSHYGADTGVGFLHVVRQGALLLRHAPGVDGVPAELRIDTPTLLFYPRPLDHSFVIDPGEPCEVVCAAVRFQGGALHPLRQALPALTVLPLADAPALGPTLNLLFSEADAVQQGERLLADRLFEVLLIQLLRGWLQQPGGISSGLMAGLAHPALSQALGALHARPAEAWSVQSLAEEAGLSRSLFAATFREVVAQTPMDYLANWRLTLAQQGLRRGTPLKRLAMDLGYGSASALSRTFTAKLGLSPKQWVAAQRPSHEPEQAAPGL